MLRFYNTLTRTLEPFEPLHEGKVGLYTCGPTVYDYAHIGNYRAYVWEDLLKRTLVYRGYRVHQVMNITDVDDKTIAGAQREGVSLDEYTARYIEAFFEDLETLRIDPADEYPRATRHIDEMIEMIRALEERGHTYQADGSLYFRIASFEDYGKLSNIDPDQVRAGTRVDADEYEKQDVRDFVLWKARKEGEPSWDSPWGPGRPGWHIECSAMSSAYLGDHFDMHTGGVDNIFPHHENEIAQSVCSTGKPFVSTWLHCAHLIVEGEKMSKSLGNFYTLRDLLDKGADPRAVRYLLLSTHYRKRLNFTLEGLDQAAAALQRVEDMVHRLRTADLSEGDDPATAEAVEGARAAFRDALDDDLNIAGALAGVFDLVRAANAALEEGRLTSTSRDQVLQAMAGFDEVVGCFDVAGGDLAEEALTLEDGRKRKVVSEVPLDEGLRGKLRERERARAEKDWATADRIRDELARDPGVSLEDTSEALHVRKD